MREAHCQSLFACSRRACAESNVSSHSLQSSSGARVGAGDSMAASPVLVVAVVVVMVTCCAVTIDSVVYKRVRGYERSFTKAS